MTHIDPEKLRMAIEDALTRALENGMTLDEVKAECEYVLEMWEEEHS